MTLAAASRRAVLMSVPLACAAALSLSACLHPRAETAIELSADPARYRRVGVLPFSDQLGLGREFAAELSKSLWKLDYDTVDLNQLETVFKSLKMDFSSELSLQDLAEVRRLTFADALLFGSVASAPPAPESPGGRLRGVSLIMIDALTGEAVFHSVFKPRGRMAPRDVAGVIGEMTASLERALRRKRGGLAPEKEEAP